MKTLDVTTGKLQTVRLYGKLGVMFGRKHRIAVNSAAEAVRALGSQLKGFEAYLMSSKDRGMAYSVFYGKSNLREDQLRNPCGNQDIRIAPILIGSKNGGWLNIILGVVLIVVGVVFSEFLGPASVPIIQMGVAMIVGGVVQLLTPTPKGKSAKDKPENTASTTFNGPVNTQAQGNPVPYLFGELIVGSAVLSAGIYTEDQAYIPGGGTPNGFGGGGGGGATRWNTDWNAGI